MACKKYHHELGATAACVVRMTEEAGLGGQGRIAFGDSWFASVKAAVALYTKLGTYFTGPIKTNSKRFPKTFLQEYFLDDEEAERGQTYSMSTMQEDTIVHAIGWFKRKTRKGKKKAYGYVSTWGTTLPGTCATAGRRDINGNKQLISIPRPQVLEAYEKGAGAIDMHNRARQGELALEKAWVTRKWRIR